MSDPTASWKAHLGAAIPADLGRQIDIFETQIELRKQGKLEEKLFAETRLRRGTYGQRYDNGKRHDGVASRTLAFPCGDLTKGPETVWDAPGMQRIKVPMGRLSATQLEVLAEVAEEYSDSILHVTTRQDIQLHFIHIDDTPDMMRRLAAAGITTQEACGNSVRNVTACQYAGVCGGQAFDVTPYATALTHYLMGHPDTQDFGRKFKIAFSGCAGEPCGLANFHDLGAIAVTRENEAGATERGFRVLVGGGLGAVPQQAKVLSEFVTADELLPTAQAVCRVFARLGERKNRARARLKFVVQKLGIDELRRVVAEEREQIPADERWSAYLGDLSTDDDGRCHREGAPLEAATAEAAGPAFARWRASNVRPQPQPGFAVATVRFPLGDFTSDQARELAALARTFCGDTLCFTVEQNLCFRWVREADLPALREALAALGLAGAGASEIGDIVACPGTDTCKLGISSSRGLAGELERRLADRELHPDVRALHIKASGCFNSCSQHHVADIGFLGVSRNVGGRRVAHFQLVVGGEWANNGGSYGLAIGAFPSRRIPDVVDRLAALWIEEREEGERLKDFIARIGRAKVKAALDDLRAVPAYEDDPSFYRDWADAREYTIGDMGVGECAGEVVSFTEFGLADSEREIFEAQIQLEAGSAPRAAELAYRSMLSAARALVRIENTTVSDDADTIVSEFRQRFHETRLFWDPFARDKFANYLFKVHAERPNGVDHEEAHRQIEEASLFIEAAHACYDRLQERGA
jgi:sulfite reductase (ferredoxin)